MIGARGPLVLGLLALAGLMAPYSAAAEARRPPNHTTDRGAPAALRPVGFRHAPYKPNAVRRGAATIRRCVLRDLSAALRPVGFIRHGLTRCLATPQARPRTGGFSLAGGRGVT